MKGSPDFHRFLTPAQYAARFGAGRATTDAVAGWLTRDGLTASCRGSDGTYLVDALRRPSRSCCRRPRKPPRSRRTPRSAGTGKESGKGKGCSKAA